MVVGQDSGNVSPGECGADRFTGLIDCGLVGLGVGGLLAVAAQVKEKAIVRTNSVFNIQIFLHSRTSTVRTTLAILPSLPSDVSNSEVMQMLQTAAFGRYALGGDSPNNPSLATPSATT